jgi:Na+/H+ antiporter NhaC
MVFLAAPAIPLIVIVLAAMAVGDWIAMHCTNGTMPSGLQWLCF